MSKTTIILTLAALSAALAGCEKEVRSVEWYKSNELELMAVIRECKANPDKLNKTENCINAKKARREMLNPGNAAN